VTTISDDAWRALLYVAQVESIDALELGQDSGVYQVLAQRTSHCWVRRRASVRVDVALTLELDEYEASRHRLRRRLLPSRCERPARSTTDECSSSNSAVSAVFTDTLASRTKHSSPAFADLGLTPATGT
jgi:hypothetical protein